MMLLEVSVNMINSQNQADLAVSCEEVSAISDFIEQEGFSVHQYDRRSSKLD